MKRFAQRFLSRLEKIEPSQVENFLSRTVQERDFIFRIFDTLVEGVVVIDREARVTLANRAAQRIFGWTRRRKFLGEPLPLLVEAGAFQSLIHSFLRNPRPLQDQEVLLHDRSRKVYNVHVLPIGEADEEPALEAAAVIVQDLTLTRDKQARNAQAEKLASLATLTAGVAHEIKNPLNSLSIHAQLLARAVRDLVPALPPGRAGQGAARVGQSCAVILEEVERLRQCVDDFIEAARPRQPSLAPADLNRVVRTVLRMAQLEFEERGIRIEAALDPGLPPLLLDETQMQRALRNLLRNAVEAIDAARRPAGEGCIRLRTAARDDCVILEVADNGCGIAEADRPKLFEPYFTTKFNGSGLGLMAVARILREHGGAVSVDCARDAGTTFILEFPILSREVKLLPRPADSPPNP